MTYGRVLEAGCWLLARWRGRKSFGRAGEHLCWKSSMSWLPQSILADESVGKCDELSHDGCADVDAADPSCCRHAYPQKGDVQVNVNVV